MEFKSFDNILIELGTGKWTIYTFFVIATMDFLVPMQVLSGTFIVPQVNFWCNDPDAPDNTATEDNYYAACYKTVNGSMNQDEYKEPCNEFAFDNSTFYTTMTSEFEMVCNENFLRASFFFIFNLGVTIGSPIGGIISDKKGRRTSFTYGSSLFIVCSVLISFLPNIWTIFTLRFIMGFANALSNQAGFLLVNEVTQPRHRAIFSILIAVPWGLGTIAWGLLGYLIRDWRYLQMASSIPMLIFIPFHWSLDESPRWLIVRGRIQEAMKVLDKIQKWNNKKLPSEEQLLPLLNKIKDTAVTTDDEKNTIAEKLKIVYDSYSSLFRKREMRRRSLVMMLDFCVASMVFYGIGLNAVNFSADPFIYMVLAGLSEIPAYVITVPIVQKFGRKYPVICGYLICGIVLFCSAFIPTDISWLVITFAMVGRFAVASAYQIIYLYAVELIPTEIRQVGVGSCNLMARVGSMFCPYIVEILGPMYPWLPAIVFGSVSIVSGLATFDVPETANKPIPDTLNDILDNST